MNSLKFVSIFSNYSYIELKRAGFTNLKIQKNRWIGMEKLISSYVEPLKIHYYEDDIE